MCPVPPVVSRGFSSVVESVVSSSSPLLVLVSLVGVSWLVVVGVSLIIVVSVPWVVVVVPVALS